MSATRQESIRFIINGIAATLVHYCVLTANIELFDIPSAGISNFIAAAVGILVSFLGSRYYVFKKTDQPIQNQALKFGTLYFSISILHASILFIWSDYYGFDYRIGFVLATFVQVTFSYLGNKFLVFKS